MSAPALQLSGVGHRFADREVLQDVSLFLAGPGVTALVGPSGCGKTTLVRIAAGLLSPATGMVRNGFPRTACVFQEDRLLPWRRVADNVAFGLRSARVPRADRVSAAGQALRQVGLTAEDGRSYPHQLSGGMRQRAALARALAVEPELLLLDEPFGATDFARRQQLMALVRGLVRDDGKTVLLVTHDLTEAATIAETIVVMTDAPGRVAEAIMPPAPPERRTVEEVLALAERLGRALAADSGFAVNGSKEIWSSDQIY